MNNDRRNMTMIMDYYELTMSNEYFLNGLKDKVVYFDHFFRKCPDNNSHVISAGLEQLMEYVENLHFTDADIEYLRSKNVFDDAFLDYLAHFRFTGDIWAVPEGTPVFPNEPIVTVRAPIIEAQLLETSLLIIMNHQSLIATKANRIVRAAQGRAISEFGSRRAQGGDAAVLGARAAVIGGCVGTACVETGLRYGVPVVGTMAHSNIQVMPTEYDAFKMYAKTYPDNCSFLVDTYNVLKSGVPNAIRVWDEMTRAHGPIKSMSVRIDSGDLAYLSKKTRKILDDAGYERATIGASNALDEYLIRDLIDQGARIDWFGVGENLITSQSSPVLSGVYKMAAVEDEYGHIVPKIKISENVGKITNPSFKKVYRLYDRDSGKALADVITLFNETINDEKPYVIFDPNQTWKRKTVTNFRAEDIRVRVFEKGKRVYDSPSVMEIQKRCKQQLGTLWDEVLRFENPHKYYVDLSLDLWNLKNDLLHQYAE